MTPTTPPRTTEQPGAVDLVVRRDDGAPYIGWWHRNEMTPLPEGGWRMTKIPDPAGPYFTTICEFNYYDAATWPELFVKALRAASPTTAPGSTVRPAQSLASERGTTG